MNERPSQEPAGAQELARIDGPAGLEHDPMHIAEFHANRLGPPRADSTKGKEADQLTFALENRDFHLSGRLAHELREFRSKKGIVELFVRALQFGPDAQFPRAQLFDGNAANQHGRRAGKLNLG